MAATALIKFTQGLVVGTAGQVLVGVTGVPVNVSNDVNTGVNSWQIDLIYTPPGSAVPITVPLAFNDSSSVPAAVFTPDVSGSYRLVLRVWDAINRTGTFNVDQRNFIIPEPKHGFVVPPYQEDPQPLPTLASGFPQGKPNETNIGGAEKGWVGNGSDGLLAHFIKTVDASNFDLMPTPSGSGVIPINAALGVPLANPFSATSDGTSVWVANVNGFTATAPALSQIDPTIPEVISTTIVGGASDFLIAVTWDGGANIWGAALLGGGSVPNLIKFPIANPASFTAYPITGVGFPFDVAYDSLNNLLWVADSGSPTVVAYNPAAPGAPVHTVATTGTNNRVFYDSVGAHYTDTNPRIWVVGPGNADRVELITFTVDGTFTLGTLAWGSVGGGSIWLTDPTAQAVYQVNPDTVALTASLPYGPTYSPQSVFYDNGLARLLILALDTTNIITLLRSDTLGNIEATGSPGITSTIPLIPTPVIALGPGSVDNFWYPDVTNSKIFAFSTLGAGTITSTEVTGPLSIQWLSTAQDLGNGYVNPKVVGIQGNPVSSSIPSNNQILAFFSGQWAPFSVFGDLHLAPFTGQTVLDKLHGSPINTSIAASPRIGSYLMFSALGWTNTSFEFGIVQSITTLSDNWDGDADVVDLNFSGSQNITFPFGVGDQGKLVWFKSSGGNPTDVITIIDPVGVHLLVTTRDKINGYAFFKYDASVAGLWTVAINPNSAIRTNPIVPISPAAITVTQDDYNPGTPAAGVPYGEVLYRLSATGAVDITGILAMPGTRITLVNIGLNTITLKHLNGGSLAANQIIGLGGVDKAISADGAAVLVYDDTSANWRVVS